MPNIEILNTVFIYLIYLFKNSNEYICFKELWIEYLINLWTSFTIEKNYKECLAVARNWWTSLDEISCSHFVWPLLDV